MKCLLVGLVLGAAGGLHWPAGIDIAANGAPGISARAVKSFERYAA